MKRPVKVAPGKPAKPASKTVATIYISNPFTVFKNSFRAVFTINFATFLTFVAVGILSISLGLLLLVSVTSAFRFEASAIWLVLLLALLIIWGLILLTAFTKYTLVTARGQQIRFTEALVVGYRKAAGYAGLMMLMAVIILGGLLLLIIPGLIFAYWFLFAPQIYVDQEVGVIEALRQSKTLVKQQPAEIFGLVGAGLLISLPGLIPILGFFYALLFDVVWYVAWAYRYVSGQKLSAQKLAKPPTDRANHWVLVVSTLALIGLMTLTIASGVANYNSQIKPY